jgi:hypothetical protein
VTEAKRRRAAELASLAGARRGPPPEVDAFEAQYPVAARSSPRCSPVAEQLLSREIDRPCLGPPGGSHAKDARDPFERLAVHITPLTGTGDRGAALGLLGRPHSGRRS